MQRCDNTSHLLLLEQNMGRLCRPVSEHHPDLLLQLFAGLSFSLLGADGKITRSVHLDVSEPKREPLNWTGF